MAVNRKILILEGLPSAHGSSESLCPKFFETHVEMVSIFKIVGASPLRSQVIPKSCRLKRCFLGIFWEKMLSHGQTVHFWPHIRKAVHLRDKMSYLEAVLVHPVRRQICGDTIELIFSSILICCHLCICTFGTYEFHFWKHWTSLFFKKFSTCWVFMLWL